MEENKKNVKESTKTPEVTTVPVEKVKAIIEEANTKLNHAFQENERLRQLLADKTLDYMFKVLENKDVFPAEFVVTIVESLQDALTAKDDVEATENTDNK